MHAVSALAMASMMTTMASSKGSFEGVLLQGDDIPFGSLLWYSYAGISCFLVLFAGIMSGLTLGLMSLGLVELEILQRSGTPAEKKQAGWSCCLPELTDRFDFSPRDKEFPFCSGMASDSSSFFLYKDDHCYLLDLFSNRHLSCLRLRC